MLRAVPLAVITGASSGIGRCIALELAARGYDLVLFARSGDGLDTVAAEIAARGGMPVTVVCETVDVSDDAQIIDCWQRLIARSGVPDILINNAGFGDLGPFAAADWTRIEGMVRVNILALTRFCHLALPLMRQAKRGRIMNVASVAAFAAGPNMATYFATKAYVKHFTEALAVENAGSGVTLTALCPGATNTEFHKVAGFRHNHHLFTGPFSSQPEAVARFAVAALLRGRRVAVFGWHNHLAIALLRIVPRRWAESVTHSVLRR